jgi:large subunit ribosomal protein L20
MVRATNSVAGRRRTKKLLKQCRGFFGARKNHVKLSQDALMSALAFNYQHRKLRKRDFRSLWIVRIGIAAKNNGMSYSRLINGLIKAKCQINRKMLSELAISDPAAFSKIVAKAQEASAA